MINPAIRFPAIGAVETYDAGPVSAGPDQVVVETHWSLMSAGTELTCLHHRFAEDTHWSRFVRYPFFPGYSSAGVVVETGAQVANLKVGDRVAVRGKHARRVLIKAAAVNPVPDRVDLADAAWIGILKIVQVAVRKVPHVLGDRVVVIGCGVLGLVLVQYLRRLGCETVIAIDTDVARCAAAEQHGATGVWTGTVATARTAVQAACDGGLPDVVYDVTGHPAVLPQALGLARDFGTVVMLGDPGDPGSQRISGDILARGVSLIGSHDSHTAAPGDARDRWTAPAMQAYLLRGLARGDLRVNDLVTHRFTPAAAPEAYALAADAKRPHLGILFDWR
ncbi:oxidoreductase [Planctomycetota bacterium]|nr:oxidoreductase [Planctomycetota bacterium]